jgi:DNA-binding CsgD family transcriptional regulator
VLSTVTSSQGFILLDARLRPVAFNSEAVQILSFPTKPESIKQLPQFLGNRIRSSLVNGGSPEMPKFVGECKSGQRTYSCRAFRINCNAAGEMPTAISFAILLERHVSSAAALANLSRDFDLTTRECETVALLLEGLTSKEIANRMHISPNTVKAFLRLVMVKMDVSTRSGIVGKALGAPH